MATTTWPQSSAHALAVPTTITEPLLGRFLEGDSGAASRLFRKLEVALRPAVRFHPVFASLKGRLTEDDVLGELWKSLFERKSLEVFDDRGPGSLRAYLRASLDRLMVDLARRAGAAKRGGGEIARSLDRSTSVARMAGEVAAEVPGPSTVARCHELVERCRQFLSAREAEVWDLRVCQGLEYGEIGERHGCTPASARGVLHRAKQHLVKMRVVDGSRSKHAGDLRASTSTDPNVKPQLGNADEVQP